MGNWRHLFPRHHVSSFTEFPPLLTRPCLCSWMRTCGRPRPTDRRSGRAVSISTMDSTAARRLTNQSVSPLALLRGALRVQTTFAFKRFGWCVCKSGHDFSETASLSLSPSLPLSLTLKGTEWVQPAPSLRLLPTLSLLPSSNSSFSFVRFLWENVNMI